MNVLLILFAAVFILFAMQGYRKGFIRMVISFGSIFVTYALVSIFQPKVSDFIKSTQLYEQAYNYIYETVETQINNKIGTDAQIDPGAEASAKIDELMEKLGLPENIKNYISDKIMFEDIVNSNIDEIKQAVTVQLTEYILSLILLVISFIIVMTAIKCLFMTANIISYLPIIHGFNKLAGLVLGMAQGVCIIWLMLLLITALGGADLNQEVFAMINDSAILSMLYKYNIFMKILS